MESDVGCTLTGVLTTQTHSTDTLQYTVVYVHKLKYTALNVQ